MKIAFDFHTLSLDIDESAKEYAKALETGLGLHAYEMRDRSKALEVRHEHAHFTSFLASGLSDVHGILSDYLLVALILILDHEPGEWPRKRFAVPLLGEASRSQAKGAEEVIRTVRDRINALRSLLVGFGTPLSIDELVDWAPHERFFNVFYDERFEPIIARFEAFLQRLGAHAPETRALPQVLVEGQLRRLSTRSVMETYALAIEVANTYFRKIETDETTYSRPVAREAPAVYTVALSYVLEHAGFPEPASVTQFFEGKAPQEQYYAVAAIAFAAMQVPVIQLLNGEVRFRGSLETLCPAHRFAGIVDALRDGRLEMLPPDVRSSTRNGVLLDWLRAAHAVIGDDRTMDVAMAIYAQFMSDRELGSRPSELRTPIELAWAARANFVGEPGDYVLDGGLFAEQFPCQVRYVRTSDHKVMMLGDVDEFQMRYILEHAVPILEAAVFPDQWDSTWAKLPETPKRGRTGMLVSTISAVAMQFGYIDPATISGVPSVRTRLH